MTMRKLIPGPNTHHSVLHHAGLLQMSYSCVCSRLTCLSAQVPCPWPDGSNRLWPGPKIIVKQWNEERGGEEEGHQQLLPPSPAISAPPSPPAVANREENGASSV
jgi:hypothetical protein